VSPNITPDEETGIGGWSDEQFLNAVTRGLSPDGDHYYPAFPYTSYTQMTVQDVIKLKAYLDSVDAVSQEVPKHDVSFPFNVRGLLSWWKLLFFDAGEYALDSQQTETWNRGAYIVQGPGHCGECHNPRNLLGEMSGSGLAGNPNGPDGETVPPLKGKRALDGWSLKDLVFALELGMKPDGDSFSGTMGEVVDEGTGHYSEADRNAVAEYLLFDRP
jgi:mono/diheme cytochrome c family protein